MKKGLLTFLEEGAGLLLDDEEEEEGAPLLPSSLELSLFSLAKMDCTREGRVLAIFLIMKEEEEGEG